MQGLGKQLTLHEDSKEVNVKPRFSKISLALDIENSKLLNPKPCADDCLALKAIQQTLTTFFLITSNSFL
jgi:hypothetical protein